MKNIYLIGGTMGVGKTATCQMMHEQGIIDEITAKLETGAGFCPICLLFVT